jgi:hypothetical protein
MNDDDAVELHDAHVCEWDAHVERAAIQGEGAIVHPALAEMYAKHGPIFPADYDQARFAREADGLRITRADDLSVERVRWLWPGFLPGGKLVLIAGPVGVSKTTVALAVSATITQAGRWPDGSHAEAGDVLVWSGEDGIADTLLPRLMAHGAELDRVHFVCDMVELGKARPFDPARDAEDLILAATRVDNLRMVLVDPVILSVRGDSNSTGDVRRGLFPLVRLAEITGAVVVGVTHFSKGTAGKQPVERVTGSLAFGAAARVVLAVARMSEDQGGGRVLLRAKNNLGPDGGGFRFDIKPIEIAGAETVRIEWGDAITGTAHDVLAAAEAREEPEEHSAISDACDFVRQVLQESGGSAERKEIIAAAKAAGHYERRVERARSRLNVAVHTTGFGKARRSVWSLPGITDTKPPTKIDSSNGSNSSYVPPLTDITDIDDNC